MKVIIENYPTFSAALIVKEDTFVSVDSADNDLDTAVTGTYRNGVMYIDAVDQGLVAKKWAELIKQLRGDER